jgi:hypothetical protein
VVCASWQTQLRKNDAQKVKARKMPASSRRLSLSWQRSAMEAEGWKPPVRKSTIHGTTLIVVRHHNSVRRPYVHFFSPSQLHVQYIGHFHFTNIDDRLIFLLHIITVKLVNLALIKIFSRALCFQSTLKVSTCSSNPDVSVFKSVRNDKRDF